MEICSISACTGCMMCADICPKEAIHFEINPQGFWYPKVDDALCVHCNGCVESCPVNIQKKNDKTSTIRAMWNKAEEERVQATSGGTFIPLAETVLAENGVVYGAGFDEEDRVCHQRIDSIQKLYKLRGSKYVQSCTKGIYNNVRADLENGRKVLFSGTPCQVSALRSFLKKDYSNLVCIDVVCHGVPSPKVFQDYLNYMNQQYDSKPTAICFRYKNPGWSVFSMKIDYENGKSYEASKFQDPFLNLFLAGKGLGDLVLRPSCFECRFTSPERSGDLTLGDFWGIKALNKSQADQEKGVSIVLVNSAKGKALLDCITPRMEIRKKDWEDALRSNQSFVRPWAKPERYETFWKDYGEMPFSRIAEIYTTYDKDEEDKKLAEATYRASAYKRPRFWVAYYLKKIMKWRRLYRR